MQEARAQAASARIAAKANTAAHLVDDDLPLRELSRQIAFEEPVTEPERYRLPEELDINISSPHHKAYASTEQGLDSHPHLCNQRDILSPCYYCTTAAEQCQPIWCDNAIHSRPPKNSLRDYPEAIIRCPGLWLYRSLANLPNLRVVVTLGATAGNLWFPGRKAGDISTLARRVPEGYTLVGAMHPSYALRVGAWMNHVDESIVKSLLRARIIAEEG